MKKGLCSTCIVGKKALMLDSSAPFCPYIALFKDNKCSMYAKEKDKDKYIVKDK